MAILDSLDLAQRLIRCPSVTPEEGGALDLLQEVLEGLGFRCRRMVFCADDTPDVDNLYARLGAAGPNFCYAGHTDVVPPGDPAQWRHDPFAAEVEDGWLYGRGAVDMKGAIAAYIGAVSRFLDARGPDFGGSLSLLITGDEEGPAVNGTRKVLDALAEEGETIDACLVGEPTSDQRLADMVKIGRRGALNARLTVRGVQGHSAYAHLADNPVHRLLAMLAGLTGEALDEGSTHFPPTSLQVTTVDVGNPATNVIPGEAAAGFDVRFSDRHTSQSVESWVRERLAAVGGDYELAVRVSGESFLTPPGPLSELIARAVEDVTGTAPELGTTGGTSDARFINDHAPVAELGLLNATAHKVDERVSLADLAALGRIYGAVLDGRFAS